MPNLKWVKHRDAAGLKAAKRVAIATANTQRSLSFAMARWLSARSWRSGGDRIQPIIGAEMDSINHRHIKRSAAVIGASAIFGLGVVGAVMAQNRDGDVNAADVTVNATPRPSPEPTPPEFRTQAIVMGVPALTGRPEPYPGGVPNRIPE